MASPRGAVKYTCVCGTEYLVAIESDQPGDDWFAVVSEAAAELGIQAIDGRQPTFVCATCGRVHERRTGDQ
jgi:hypothetical protein